MTAVRIAVWLAAIALAGCATQPGARNRDKDPEKLAELHVQMAAEYMRQGNFETAMNRLEKALDYDRNYAPAHSTLGILYNRLGDNAKAEKHFRDAAALAPNDSSVLNNYGQFLCQQGRYDEGMSMFERALANPLYRAPAVAHTNAGLCALARGDNATAEQRFRDALRLEPKFAPALLQMCRQSLEAGEHLSARAYLQRYLEVADHTAQTLWMGVRIERALGDRDTAGGYALLLRSRFPDSDEARMLQESGGS
ncbi:MAG: type IV pilus biogenesis/stability protein PilW [Gammaproteobacteria bacterium]|nr:type IV pilus biogenesis/stability protein PilW [Gammaproteobacteria bacterium]